MNNAGLRGGERHEGCALQTVRRGLFQRNGPLAQGFSVASPRPLVMPAWLAKGTQCGLRKSLPGEKNFKIKRKKKKAQPTPFSSLLQPQSKSTVCAIEKSHLRSSVHFLTASAKIADEADRNKRVPFSCCIMRWTPCTSVQARQ